MARLADEILNCESINESELIPDDRFISSPRSDILPQLKYFVELKPKIVIDDVYQYMTIAGNEKVCCIRPPFKHVWMEFIAENGYTVGAAITDDIGEHNSIHMAVFAKSKLRGIFMIGIANITVNLNLEPITVELDGFDNKCNEQEISNIYSTFMVALHLLNHKGLPIADSKPVDAALQKARVRRGKKPLMEYKIISIIAGKPKTNGNHQQSPQGGHYRMHTVRGHPRIYTKEKPLFGKFSGMVWVSPHVAGQAALGEVKKDYVLKMADGRVHST